MNKVRLTLLLNICLTAICFAKNELDTSILKANVETYLQQQVEKTNAPSLSIAVGHKGRVLFSAVAGLADKSRNVKADIYTQYRTGSVSKVIGTVAFMPLIEQNKVRLDDKIRRYLPYLPTHYDDIQVKHILTHTSGIRHYRFGEYGTNTHYSTLQEATRVFREDPLLFEPGSRYTYTTYGINLIQGIIEERTQQPLSDYLQNVLFEPLQMTNTELEIKGNASKHYAVGYRSFLSSLPVKEIDVSNKYIGGGMRTTPTDLVKMVQAVAHGKVMSEKTKALMLTVPFSQVASDRALGWRWLNHDGHKGIAHGGAINGFESFLVHFIDTDITVAVMVNQDGYDHTSDTLYSVFDIVKTASQK